MLNHEVQSAVEEEIRELLIETSDDAVEVTAEDELVELGLNSLMLARLIIQLETVLGVDPFGDGIAEISEVRSVGDLAAAYERAMPAAGDRV